MEIIDKKTLEKLAVLGRVEISADKEEKLLNDLRVILGHFGELNEVNVVDVEPMSGAVELTNVFRDDKPIKSEAESEDLISAFPDKEKRFLKVPGVFE